MTLVAPPVGGMLRLVTLVPTEEGQVGATVVEFDPANQRYALEQAGRNSRRPSRASSR